MGLDPEKNSSSLGVAQAAGEAPILTDTYQAQNLTNCFQTDRPGDERPVLLIDARKKTVSNPPKSVAPRDAP